MKRVAVFVDASYLFLAGITLLSGERQRREQISSDIPKIIAGLKNTARSVCTAEFLRVYWYDATYQGRITPDQIRVADTPDVKLRLGQINTAGEQKGVDTLITSDLTDMARTGAISDAVLMTGDEDIRIGMFQTQQLGVRVHLIGVQPIASNQSRTLSQEADTVTEWDESLLRSMLRYTPPTPPTPPQNVPSVVPELDISVEAYVKSLQQHDIDKLKVWFVSNASVPSEYDRALLYVGRAYYGRDDLTMTERAALRTSLISIINGGVMLKQS